jgi:peptidoglycan/LPS O-acetylase OafA/YrhL
MPKRLHALDGLRGLLALYILAGHTLPYVALPPTLVGIGRFVSHGRGAVDLFFTLSGLVIIGSLDHIARTPQPVWRFLLARAGRLLPVYLIALILAAAALCLGDPFATMSWLPIGGAPHDIQEAGWPRPWFWHLAVHIVLLQGIVPSALLADGEYSILGPAWSLSTEWQFYAVMALVLACCGDRITRPTALQCWIIGLLILGGLGPAMAALPPAWQFSRAFLPEEAWYFALGIASFVWLRSPGDGAVRLVFTITLAAACLLSWAATRMNAALVPLAWVLCLACQVRPMSPAIVRRPLNLGYRMLTCPFLLWAGQISYSLYLTHAPVQRLLMLWLAPRADGDWSRFTLAWLGPAIALPLLVALVVHHCVEEPIRRWSHERVAAPGALRFRSPLYAAGSNTSAAGRP